MTLHFDWLELETDEFEADLEDLVAVVYKVAADQVDKTNMAIINGAAEELARAQSNQEHDDAWSMLQWEEEQAAERSRILGGLTLTHLVSVLMARVRSIKAHFDKSHPPKPPYEGKSELDRLLREHGQRFGLDLDKSPHGLDFFREMVLARNSFIHNEGAPSQDYLKRFPAPTYVDDSGKVSLTPTQFNEAIERSKKFVKWLVGELISFREASRNTKK